MAESVLAAVRTAPETTEFREFDMPDVPDDGALLKVEVAGICGTDVKFYSKPPITDPVIMGHENIGYIAKAGKSFQKRRGLKEGDLVFAEHYVGCMNCEHCHRGEYRLCMATDWRKNPEGIRFGYTSANRAPHLWGGFAQYMYLPWNAILHKVPDGLSPELAGVVTPMANGIQWALFDCGVGYNSRVLVQGPGQQGLSQVVACRQAGAALIIVTGTNKDVKRLDVALKLGADYVINVETEDPVERIREITSGEGVDVALDCTAGAGTAPILLGIEALKRKGGSLLVQQEVGEFPNFPLAKLCNKYATVKCARGHNYESCELALQQLNSDRFDLDLITTHRFGLKDTHDAIKAVGGSGDVIHVSMMPWQ
ncbi:zinc-binding dehydrogenase [Puniceibacterium sp. IMCC21224]|uniref:zinc-dependent alcohol dehydrogenase n=1 Tax=Puniceibacterium sp. IMCC21224 TaxID=1618204 RepID=UPI00064D7723|nr:alcohol dehydrogenase catalytic domain-containing protein [Puniceibacterium sp. IMCC21224]KMK65025.1 theronine dehydrogenase-like Zn-dependent dehydrogenase [Puniceibacterium sp. IMCC21224]